MAETAVGPIGWERAIMAAEKVKERLRRATKALDAAGVPYAVVGGNAVADWVARIDEDAIRNTRDVDLLVHRTSVYDVRAALESAGFVYCQLLDVDMFIDGPHGKPSGGVTSSYTKYRAPRSLRRCRSGWCFFWLCQRAWGTHLTSARIHDDTSGLRRDTFDSGSGSTEHRLHHY